MARFLATILNAILLHKKSRYVHVTMQLWARLHYNVLGTALLALGTVPLFFGTARHVYCHHVHTYTSTRKRLRVDGRRKQTEKSPFSHENVHVWTGDLST